MARTLEVRLTDDLDGTMVARGRGQTIRFTFDGTAFEIDLSDKNAAAMRKALAPYLEAARPVTDALSQSNEPTVTTVESIAVEVPPSSPDSNKPDTSERTPAKKAESPGAKRATSARQAKKNSISKPVAADTDPAVIKEWARANGYEVKDRGRLSNEVKEAYAAAI